MLSNKLKLRCPLSFERAGNFGGSGAIGPGGDCLWVGFGLAGFRHSGMVQGGFEVVLGRIQGGFQVVEGC